MASTDSLGGVMKQKAVGACGLISVVLDNQRLAREICQQEWRQCRPGHVDHVRGSNELPESHETRITDDSKREGAIIVILRGSLRYPREFEFLRLIRIAKFGKAAGKR